ncbi:MAG TPA: ABC transporter permease [Acidobacteriota bacterium]|nr:ABC transporter permease [Acidobacteriota bacterium]
MFRDVKSIVWKELKEILGQRGRLKGGKTGMLFFLLVFGALLPLQNGAGWIRSPLVLIYWSWVPFLLASGVVADSFAGERERHTLETLLASRLPDRAILAGKIGAAVIYAWGLTLACVLAGAVTINLAHGHGRVLFYPAPVAAGIVGLTFLVALLASGLGVLVSLRAATVRQAQQTFSIAFFLMFIPLFTLPMLPAALKARLFASLSGVDAATAALAAAALLALADIVLLAAADARFRRNRLILD